MFFVTDLPILFNVKTGVVTKIEESDYNGQDVFQVTVNSQRVYVGSAEECKDFIFSLAGWVGAVNPVTLERASNESAS